MLVSRTVARRRDALLGAGLVGAFALVAASTSWALANGGNELMTELVVVGLTIALDIGLLCLPWRRLNSAFLLVFPFLLVGAEVGLAVSTAGIPSNHVGMFTLAFLYVGLTQDLVVVPLFAVVAAPGWLICVVNSSTKTVVRLMTATTIWLSIGWVFAARTPRDRVLERELIARACTDALTGMPSRLLPADQIARELAAPGRSTSSVMVLDLDGFKRVNDTFGHASGDELLIAVADRIRASVRPDDRCARLGGDEFAVLLRHVDLQAASIGVAGLDGAVNAQAVIRDADLAMYEAKSAGRNQLFVFECDMQERRAERLQLETELRDGVDRGEFELHYQPVVHLQTGAIIGTGAARNRRRLASARHPGRHRPSR
jgi:GGDEF domain-containing protein